MSVNQFELEQYPVPGPGRAQRFCHGPELVLAGKSAAAPGQHISCSCAGKVLEELVGRLITDREPVDIQYRVAQSRPDKSVADVVHVGKAHDMRRIVDIGPCCCDFLETVGPQRRKGEYAANLQYACHFLENRLRFGYQGQELVCRDEVERSVCERQLTRIRLDKRTTSEPRASLVRLCKHRMTQVERNDVHTFVAFAQGASQATGRGPDIQDSRRLDYERIETAHQAISRDGVDEIRIVKSDGGSVETSLDVSGLRHWRTVPRFLWKTAGNDARQRR